ncbi:MAG: HAD family phosphatase [Candidatus Thermoplasmatota archaeon]|nr:HAD family phosphatase [Candidatus Thermoplasmatota archaeon]
MARPSIQAVIFDFDGVLVQSIELHAYAYNAVLQPFGIKAPVLDVMRMEGARSESIIREFMERAGMDPEPALVERLAELKQEAFERLGTPKPYAWSKQVVEAVAQRGFPMAICTGTRRENVPGIAPELVDHFQALATQETYDHDKPHPEPYLKAASLLGIPAEHCLVVENAPRGVRSARDAGARVVAVTTTLPAEELMDAHVIIDELPELLEILPATPGQVAAERS